MGDIAQSLVCLRLLPELDHVINSWFVPVAFDLFTRGFGAFIERKLMFRWKKTTIFPINDSCNLKCLRVDQYILL